MSISNSCLYRYFPFGLNGILAGSAIVFFSYIGFDTVTSTAEEVHRLLTSTYVFLELSSLFFLLKGLTLMIQYRTSNRRGPFVLVVLSTLSSIIPPIFLVKLLKFWYCHNRLKILKEIFHSALGSRY